MSPRTSDQSAVTRQSKSNTTISLPLPSISGDKSPVLSETNAEPGHSESKDTTRFNATCSPFSLPRVSTALREGEFEDLYKFWSQKDEFEGRRETIARDTRPGGRSLPRNLRFLSVTHPNSPYVPWSEEQRQEFLGSSETLKDIQIIPEDSKQWVKVSLVTSSLNMTQPKEAGLRRKFLDKVLKYLHRIRRSALQARFRSLDLVSTPMDFRTSVTRPYPVSKVVDSYISLSSVESTSLGEWLASREQDSIIDNEACHRIVYPSLGDYEHKGSWIARAQGTMAAGGSPSTSPSPTIICYPESTHSLSPPTSYHEKDS